MIFVVNIFSSFVSNVFSEVIKRILGVFGDETEEFKEEEEEKTTRKDDAHRSKGINIFVLRLIKSRLLSPRSLRRVHPLWLLCRVLFSNFGERRYFLHPKVAIRISILKTTSELTAHCHASSLTRKKCMNTRESNF